MSKQLSYEEEALLLRVSQGNQQAFKLLFDKYRDRLFYYINGFIKSEQVTEELVLDVFMKIWLGREMIPEIANFDSFLFRIAHNKSVDFLRSAARNLKLQDLLIKQMESLQSTEADAQLIIKEFEENLREAINLLPPRRKEVYLLSREHDLSHDEIAAKLNISKNTVGNQIVEAQRFIRSFLSTKMKMGLVIFLFSEEIKNF